MMSKQRIQQKVKESFAGSEIYGYSIRKGFVHPEDPIILNFIKNKCTFDSKILEVGGGAVVIC